MPGMRRYKILVCCGTAGATATILADKLKRKLGEFQIELERVDKIQISNLKGVADNGVYDIVVTAVDIPESSVSVPVIKAIGLLTGFGEEQDLRRIAEALKRIDGGDSE